MEAAKRLQLEKDAFKAELMSARRQEPAKEIKVISRSKSKQ
jgi:hypothetical protein